MSENVRSSRKLSSKQLRALELLLEGGTQSDTAEAIGVSPRTLRRWISEDPEFQAELKDLSRSALAAASLSLVGSMDSAIASLKNITSNESNPASIRVRAADITLAYALKYIEVMDIEQRLTELEGNKKWNHEKQSEK